MYNMAVWWSAIVTSKLNYADVSYTYGNPLPNCQIKSTNTHWHFRTQPPNFIATFISGYTVPKCGVPPPYQQARSNDQKFD